MNIIYTEVHGCNLIKLLELKKNKVGSFIGKLLPSIDSEDG